MLPKNFAKSGGFGKKIKRENGHIEGWVVYRRREGGGVKHFAHYGLALSLLEETSKKWILPSRNSCIRK